MHKYADLKEGDVVECYSPQKAWVFDLVVLYKDRELVHLRRRSPVAPHGITYKLDRRTGKLYMWTPTGWDNLPYTVREGSEELFMGD